MYQSLTPQPSRWLPILRILMINGIVASAAFAVTLPSFVHDKAASSRNGPTPMVPVSPANPPAARPAPQEPLERDKLVGEWQDSSTGKKVQFWSDGHYGSCSIISESEWTVSTRGNLHLHFCFADWDFDYHFAKNGDLILGDGLIKGRYRRSSKLATCRDERRQPSIR